MNKQYPYHLVFFDMDGVIFQDENTWMQLHKQLGTLDEGKKLTEQYLHTDYQRLVHEVVEKLWKGKDAAPYQKLIEERPYIQGISDVFSYLQERGAITCIISASPLDLARRAQRDLGVDLIFANSLGVTDGKIAGSFHWPVGEGRHEKPRIVKQVQEIYNVPKENCAYIGDNKNDVLAFNEVALSIAYNATHEEVREAATHVVEGDSIDTIIPYLS